MHRQAALTKNICSLKEISEKQVHEYQPCDDNESDETLQIPYSATCHFSAAVIMFMSVMQRHGIIILSRQIKT